MRTIMIGAEFVDFWRDQIIAESAFVYDSCIRIDGIEVDDPEPTSVHLSSIVEILYGIYVDSDGTEYPLIDVFSKWRKINEKAYIVVEVPLNEIDKFMNHMEIEEWTVFK